MLHTYVAKISQGRFWLAAHVLKISNTQKLVFRSFGFNFEFFILHYEWGWIHRPKSSQPISVLGLFSGTLFDWMRNDWTMLSNLYILAVGTNSKILIFSGLWKILVLCRNKLSLFWSLQKICEFDQWSGSSWLTANLRAKLRDTVCVRSFSLAAFWRSLNPGQSRHHRWLNQLLGPMIAAFSGSRKLADEKSWYIR